MMKLFVKKLLFCLIIIIGITTMLVFRTPLRTQSDLMSLIDTNNISQQWPIKDISLKFSSLITIVTESSDEKISRKSANKIIKLLNSEQFNALKAQSDNFSFKDVTKDLIAYKNNFLSQKYRNFLQTNNARQITDNAINQISLSMMPPLIPFGKDPFLLLSDYLLNINNNISGWTLNNGLLWQYKDSKNYFMIPVDVDTKSPESTKQINLLYKQLSNQNSEQIHIYVTGVPLHTATMVQKSQIQLTVLSLIAVLMAILFSYLLFKKLLTTMTVLISLSVGFLAGTIALFLCFATPHILTFVFGTTLIGLGIDYSFHCLTAATASNKKQIQTNMTHSFLTTLVCFLPLLFSGVSLLQQISIFTIVGLTTIYVGLLLFVPDKLNLRPKSINLHIDLSHTAKMIIFLIICAVIIATLPFTKTQNNMSMLYKPDSEIAANEIIVQKLNNSQQSAILMIRAHNIQELLETEEDIKKDGNTFFSLSSIIPSIKTQTENQELVKKLYSSESKYLKQKLELRKTPTFSENSYLDPDNIESKFVRQWIDKFIIQNDDYIYSVAQVPPTTQITHKNAKILSISQNLTQQIKQYTSETYRLLIICGVCLIGLLSILYKRRAIIYLIPSTLAILLSVCILTWFGQPITFFHMLAFFIVMGLGLDYTIFNINSSDNTEMRPVLFSFLTSFIGFGLLAFTSFFLIKSMGIILGLGLGLSYIISLFLFRTNKAHNRRI